MRKLICLLSVLALLIGMLSALASCRGRETDLDLPENTGTPAEETTGSKNPLPPADDKEHPVYYTDEVSRTDFLTFSSKTEAVEYFGRQVGVQNDIVPTSTNELVGFLGEEFYFFSVFRIQEINGEDQFYNTLMKTKVKDGKAVGSKSQVCLDPLCPHDLTSDCPFLNVGGFVAVGDTLFYTRNHGLDLNGDPQDIREVTTFESYNYKTGEHKVIERVNTPIKLQQIGEKCCYIKSVQQKDLSLRKYWYEIDEKGNLTLFHTSPQIPAETGLHTIYQDKYEVAITNIDERGNSLKDPETGRRLLRLMVFDYTTGMCLKEETHIYGSYFGPVNGKILVASTETVDSWWGYTNPARGSVFVQQYDLFDIETMEWEHILTAPLSPDYVSDKCIVMTSNMVNTEFPTAAVYWFDDKRLELSVLDNPEIDRSLIISLDFDSEHGVIVMYKKNTDPTGAGVPYYWYNPVSGNILCLSGKKSVAQ